MFVVLYLGGQKRPYFALIAQLDRASGYGPEGREFESSSARQNNSSTLVVELLFFYILKKILKVWSDSKKQKLSTQKGRQLFNLITQIILNKRLKESISVNSTDKVTGIIMSCNIGWVFG